MRKIDADALMVELMDLDLDHVQANDYRELNQIIDNSQHYQKKRTGYQSVKCCRRFLHRSR